MSGGVLLYVDAKSVERNEAGVPFSAALAGFKLRQRNAVAAVFEYHFHRHIDADFIDWTADDVAAESRPIVQVDPCGDVGNVRREAAQRLADDFANGPNIWRDLTICSMPSRLGTPLPLDVLR